VVDSFELTETISASAFGAVPALLAIFAKPDIVVVNLEPRHTKR
jgi:hypothetical protein